jgi:hypothetical protein
LQKQANPCMFMNRSYVHKIPTSDYIQFRPSENG